MNNRPTLSPRWFHALLIAFIQIFFFGPFVVLANKIQGVPNVLQILFLQYFAAALSLRFLQIKPVVEGISWSSILKLSGMTSLFYLLLSPLKYLMLVGAFAENEKVLENLSFLPNKISPLYLIGVVLGILLHFIITSLGIKFLMKKNKIL